MAAGNAHSSRDPARIRVDSAHSRGSSCTGCLTGWCGAANQIPKRQLDHAAYSSESALRCSVAPIWEGARQNGISGPRMVLRSNSPARSGADRGADPPSGGRKGRGHRFCTAKIAIAGSRRVSRSMPPQKISRSWHRDPLAKSMGLRPFWIHPGTGCDRHTLRTSTGLSSASPQAHPNLHPGLNPGVSLQE